MAKSGVLRRASSTAAIGALVFLSTLTALFAFLALLFGLLFGGLFPSLFTATIMLAISCTGVVTACMFVVRRLALRSQSRLGSD